MKPTTLARLVARFAQDESGPTATEYAVMLALVLIVILASVTLLGQGLGTEYQEINTSLFP